MLVQCSLSDDSGLRGSEPRLSNETRNGRIIHLVRLLLAIGWHAVHYFAQCTVFLTRRAYA